MISKNLRPLINLFLSYLKLKDLLENPIPCCGDKGPNLYTGPWALFDYVDASEEK